MSAGNTGAVMAIAKMVQGMIRGVQRPALASAFPTLKGTPVVVVDVGANVDSTPAMLAQFAVMGEIYSRYIFKIRSPRVGLLSIGEEEHKGNDLTRAATPLLKSLPLHFIGNVEGRDIFRPRRRGGLRRLHRQRRAEGERRPGPETLASCSRNRWKGHHREARLCPRRGKPTPTSSKRVDYSEYGGAPLLGVKGVSIICHGRSNANAIKNAIRVASEFAHSRINENFAATGNASRSGDGRGPPMRRRPRRSSGISA